MKPDFTDRARKIMVLAEAEARRLNHESVGPDHLFLGLLREGSGVAAHTLKRLLAPPESGSCANLRMLLSETERFVAAPAAGRNLETPLPLNPEAERAVSNAIEESKSFKHDYVGTEHFLLGLLRQPEGVAQQVLSIRGITLEQVRDSVSDLLSEAPARKPGPVTRFIQWVCH